MARLKTTVDLNEAFQEALHLMENTTKHVFVTGRAGTGKSTLLNHFKKHTVKNVVLLAPTGVAAVNIAGQTIHSFFRFKPDITVEKVRKIKVGGRDELYRKLQAIVIDEISMVRADVLDCVDTFLRLHGPKKGMVFGGVQMIFIGDLYQLPPVTTNDESSAFREHYESPYFFSAHAISPKKRDLFAVDPLKMECVELEKVYRQRDAAFIALLNAVRTNTADQSVYTALNKRLDRSFVPPKNNVYVTLTTTNKAADEINYEALARLKGQELVYRGDTQGTFDAKYLPTESELHLKVGAQVMMLNNDVSGRWINGTVGVIKSVEDDTTDKRAPQILSVELETGETVRVTRHQWDIYSFSFNRDLGKIESESVGSFTQYPMRLAWAITIHKSQGKTFDNVIVDIGRGTFSPGQLYVALSRATSLEGLVLKRPVGPEHVWLDTRVHDFISSFR
jgi:ATP-dependent exoDNAse (exonuclease V) alpha subunit